LTIFHFKNLLKYSLITFIIYNLITLTLLFTPSNSLKLKLWNLTPYDYRYILDFPNNFNKKSILNGVNRNEIGSFLDKNISKNLLNINFWNQKLIIENYDKKKIKSLKNHSQVYFF
tara:strand:- start:141 stop:488 length:348 start_codon:yes stop_codon:yes gene_type:complete